MPHYLDILIHKLEFAQQSDRELDNLIEAALARPILDDCAGWPPRYTFSMDAALTLIPSEFVGWWQIGRGKVTSFQAEVRRYRADTDYDCCAASSRVAPIAICLVALKARRKVEGI